MTQQTVNWQICPQCGEKFELLGIPYPGSELCRPCRADSFGCTRCGRWWPSSERRGGYCRECRREYNAAHYAARRKGKP